MADLTINFGFVSSAQTHQSYQREIAASTNAFARLIVDDVAFNIATYSSQQAHRTLAQSVRKAVDQEIATMAMTIGHSISVTQARTGPSGVMSAHGQPSKTAMDRGWYRDLYNWNRGSTGIKWGKRKPSYLRWKQKNGYTSNWWEKDGALKRYLAEPRTYTEAFGPVRVIFDRPKNQARARERLGANPRITASGLTGPIVSEYEVGKLRVIALGNITPADLPSLITENPKDAKPSGNRNLASFLRDEDARDRLQRPAWENKQQRHVLEPFISFYLTRAIPNAVWRRIEQQPIRLDEGAGRTR